MQYGQLLPKNSKYILEFFGYCLQIQNYAEMWRVSQNIIPCEKFTLHLHIDYMMFIILSVRFYNK